MTKTPSPTAGTTARPISRMRACGGASRLMRSMNASTDSGGPSTSMRTPVGQLRTHPARRSSVASR